MSTIWGSPEQWLCNLHTTASAFPLPGLLPLQEAPRPGPPAVSTTMEVLEKKISPFHFTTPMFNPGVQVAAYICTYSPLSTFTTKEQPDDVGVSVTRWKEGKGRAFSWTQHLWDTARWLEHSKPRGWSSAFHTLNTQHGQVGVILKPNESWIQGAYLICNMNYNCQTYWNTQVLSSKKWVFFSFSK